jgi:hypothetical protein
MRLLKLSVELVVDLSYLQKLTKEKFHNFSLVEEEIFN